MKPRPRLHLIGGPTASGKTALALEIARQEKGCVINADAMQVYAGLPLLTAQPSTAEKTAAPHELFEIFDAAEKSSAGKWLSLATEAVDRAVKKNLTPIVVGGTGLYFKALLGGLADMPRVSEAAHTETAALYEKLGHDAFRRLLAERDPESAARITTNDKQRLIRAYEIAKYTEKTLPAWQKESLQRGPGSLGERFDIQTHLLLPDRGALYAACDARFLKMVEHGALEEARALAARKLDPELPAMKILGVRELAAHLRGEIPIEEAIALAQQHTRNYAKRQITWFKNQWNAVTAA